MFGELIKTNEFSLVPPMFVLSPVNQSLKLELGQIASDIWQDSGVAYQVSSAGGLIGGDNASLQFNAFNAGEAYDENTAILAMNFWQSWQINWSSPSPDIATNIAVVVRGVPFSLRQGIWYRLRDNEQLPYPPVPDADQFLQFEGQSNVIVEELIDRVLSNPVTFPDRSSKIGLE